MLHSRVEATKFENALDSGVTWDILVNILER